MKNLLPSFGSASFITLLFLVGCGGELLYQKDIEQLSKPGLLDAKLTGIYDTYKFKFLDKYHASHQWPRNSDGCRYAGVSTLSPKVAIANGDVYAIRDIYEEGNSTKQRGAHPSWNFDRFVRGVKRQQPIYAPATKDEIDKSNKAMWERIERQRKTGVFEKPPPDMRKPIRYEEIEEGFRPICFESWWVPSNYVTLELHKRTLSVMKQVFSERYPEGVWTTRTVNNRVWQVQETAEDKMRNRPPNGVGGPYQSWLLPIGDTDYTMAFELGASKESLQYPEVQAKMRAMFMRLIESVSIEPILGNSPVSPPVTSTSPCEAGVGDSERCQPPENATTSTRKGAQPAPKTSVDPYAFPNEYPDKPTQLQQQMESDSRHEMNRMLRNTMPKQH